VQEWESAEAWSCIAGDGRWRGRDTVLDRDEQGRIRYRWVRGGDRLDPGRVRRLVEWGSLLEMEAPRPLIDAVTGQSLQPGRGSVFWNDFRRRWIWLGAAAPGEVWFAEAGSPVGPWGYAVRVAHHGDHNFYNPTQHPFFDQDGGRRVYFEGTYTVSFSKATARTPRYEYNQLMYRIDLDHPRLRLPVAVHRLPGREDPEAETVSLGDRADGLASGRMDGAELLFFALPPRDGGEGIPVPAWVEGRPTASPAFVGMPSGGTDPDVRTPWPGLSPHLEDLHRETHRIRGWVRYRTASTPRESEWDRDPQAVCRVWRHPTRVLDWDFAGLPSRQSPR
jgi:hypothetical protein